MTDFKVGDRVRTKYAGEITTITSFEGFDLPYPYRLANTVKNGGDGSGRSKLVRADEIELVKTAYLAGPMTGIDLFNFPAFEDATEDLRARGWTVISPAEMDIEEGFTPSASGDDQAPEEYAAFLARDIEKIAQANIDAIIVLPGWEKSGGAKTEVAFCRALGKDVLAYPDLDPVKDPDEPVPGKTPIVVTIDRAITKSEYRAMMDAVGQHYKFKFTGGGTIATGEDDFYNAGETRVVNAETGGEKGTKPERMELIPWDVLREFVAPHYAAGAAKYDDNNWRRGYLWSLSFGALQRHASLFWSGEDLDEETGTHHMAAVVFHALALLLFAKDHTSLDDRPWTAAERSKT